MTASVSSIGTAVGSFGNATLTGVTIAAGSTIVVEVSDRATSIGSQGVTDTSGNVYRRVTSALHGTNVLGSIYDCHDCLALAGGTITITPASSSTSEMPVSVSAISGLPAGDQLDTAVTATATGTVTSGGTSSVTSGTPSQANNLFFGMSSTFYNPAPTVTQPTGWANGQSVEDTASPGRFLTGATFQSSGSSAQTYNPTFSNSSTDFVNIIIGYKTASSGTAYSLTAAQGSFAQTGEASSLIWGALLGATNASFALTGEAANLTYSPAVGGRTYGSGAYGEGNYSASTFSTLTCVSGSYTQTGKTSNTVVNALVAAVVGTFTDTGEAASFVWRSKVPASNGAFSQTGKASGLLWHSIAAASAGAFSLAGEDASFVWSATATALAGSFALAGQAFDFSFGNIWSTQPDTSADWASQQPGAAQWTPAATSSGNWTPT
jgi:hypothetical protein